MPCFPAKDWEDSVSVECTLHGFKHQGWLTDSRNPEIPILTLDGHFGRAEADLTTTGTPTADPSPFDDVPILLGNYCGWKIHQP